jgi:hypothetical protein
VRASQVSRSKKRSRSRPTSDWREELQKHPKVVELRRLLWKKWRVLGRDKEFLRETSKLRHRLERAFEIDQESVDHFFRSYSCPTGKRLRKILRYISAIDEKWVRNVLRRYVKYVARFGASAW